MKWVLMNLEGHQMSFGYNSNGLYRYTLDFPTASALYGMICCGMGRNGDLTGVFDKLRKIKIDVFALTKSHIETDFQTIGNGWKNTEHWFRDKNASKVHNDINLSEYMIEQNINGKKAECPTSLIDKYYLVNQRFLVLLEIDDDAFAGDIAEALRHPVWQMYLGRKKCIPCGRVFYGIFDSREDAMNVVDSLKPLYLYSEDEPDDYIDEINVHDVPTTEFNKYSTYTHRRVYKSLYHR